jgi:uncharacterized membrane protein YfcA
MQTTHYLALFGAAFLGGAINAVAGGGTLVTFPTLIWAGVPLTVANATSTVALWPGQLSSLWNYRDEMSKAKQIMLRFALPSLLGGLLGSLLLVLTPEAQFKAIVPYLILTATLLFLFQEPLSRWQKRRADRLKEEDEKDHTHVHATAEGDPVFASSSAAMSAWAGLLFFQFLVSVYGGYFGAGIGILQLAAFGLMGFTNIHRMNGFKNINGLIINAVAIAIFISHGIIWWGVALLMAVGSILGGYFGAGTAKKIGAKNVRKIVIAIGFALTIKMLVQR